MNARMYAFGRTTILVGLFALACGSDGGGDGSSGSGADASSDTRGVEESADDRGDGEVTTSPSRDSEFDDASDDGIDDGSGFIMNPDGGPGDGCEQPEPLEQPASCDNGVREPDELCYQGIASISVMAEGTRLADFGAGPQVVYSPIENGDGVFMHPATAEGLLAPPAILDVPYAYDLDVADLDGDGWLDLVVAHADDDGGLVSVLRGLGDGTFAPWTTSSVASMWHLQLADFDGDAHPDLVGTTDRYYDLGDLHLARGTGNGEWMDDDIVDLGDDVWPEIGDLDGDGLDDLAVLVTNSFTEDPREIVVLPMTPTGPASGWLLEEGEVGRAVLGRYDEDAVLDVAYWRDGDLVTRFGLGDGTFSEPIVEPVDVGPLAAADLDGDGRSEIISATSVRSAATGEVWEFDLGCGHYGAKLVSTWDIDDDGLRDIVISTGYGQRAGALHLIESNP